MDVLLLYKVSGVVKRILKEYWKGEQRWYPPGGDRGVGQHTKINPAQRFGNGSFDCDTDSLTVNGPALTGGRSSHVVRP